MFHPHPSTQRGIATVELALVLIPLIMLLFGITEFGRAFYQYNTLVKSTRNVARYLSTQLPAQHLAEATCLAVYANTTCSPGKEIVPGLNTTMISICDATSCPATHYNVPKIEGSGNMNLVTVSIVNFTFISGVNIKLGAHQQWQIGTPDITFPTISATFRQGS